MKPSLRCRVGERRMTNAAASGQVLLGAREGCGWLPSSGLGWATL